MFQSPNRTVALLIAAVCAGGGAFALVTGRPAWAAVLLVGAVVLLPAAVLGVSTARRANIAAGTAWLTLGIVGLFLIGTPANILGLVAADEVLLFASATLQLAAGLGARRDRPDAE